MLSEEHHAVIDTEALFEIQKVDAVHRARRSTGIQNVFIDETVLDRGVDGRQCPVPWLERHRPATGRQPAAIFSLAALGRK
jgi:hypothetical protein